MLSDIGAEVHSEDKLIVLSIRTEKCDPALDLDDGTEHTLYTVRLWINGVLEDLVNTRHNHVALVHGTTILRMIRAYDQDQDIKKFRAQLEELSI